MTIERRGVAYGEGAAQRLDLYAPDNADGAPVLIFVHGGAWTSGERAMYAPVAQLLVPQGLVVVIAGYTLFPAGTYRRQADDVARAIVWTLDHVAEVGGDPARVVVGGHSAGAHLTSLAVADPRRLAAHGRAPADLCGLFGISGIYDLSSLGGAGQFGRFIVALAEGQANLAGASPISYARRDLPPVLLIHGDADTSVALSSSERFHAALQRAGAKSTLTVYPGVGHVDILLGAVGARSNRLVADLVDFTRRCAVG